MTSTPPADPHALVVDHACDHYPEMPGDDCYAAEACAVCGVRRDEHADQAVQSGLPALDVTDHAYRQRASVTLVYIDTTVCEGEGPSHATTFVTDGHRIAALPAEHADLDDVERDGDLVRVRCGGRASDPEDQCTSTHHLNLATDWIPAHPEWLAALAEHGEDLPA